MKRVLQFVAVALVAFLATQPALAGLTCGMKPLPAAACTPACGPEMARMGTRCPMHPAGAGTGCLQDCCRNGWPQAVVQSPAKSKKTAVPAQILPLVLGSTPAGIRGFAIPPPGAIAAGAPDRHVLLRVFRI